MKFKMYLFNLWILATACNSAPETNQKSLAKLKVKSEQELASVKNINSPNSNTETDILTVKQFKIPQISIDSVNEYGAGDCFGKVYYYPQKNFNLGVDSMSCGEYGYTNTLYLIDSKKMVQAIYLKKSESLDQPDGTWKYALLERLIDFRNNQATIQEKIDTVNDETQNLINKKFKIKKIKDRQTSLEHWNNEFRELWEKEEEY